MVVNKLKLLAASSLAVVGLAGAGAIHMASAQTPAPAVTSAVQAPASSINDAETTDSPTGATTGGNSQQGDQAGADKETNNAPETGNSTLNNQQGDQSTPDTSSATDKQD
jgi:hypothetical protein